jgi:hypothetical protein
MAQLPSIPPEHAGLPVLLEASWGPVRVPSVVLDSDAADLAGLEHPVVLAVEMGRRESTEILGGLAGLAMEGRPIYCVDAWNRFNPYAFAQWCRTRGLSGRLLLDRVFVSRCFTIHQLEAVVMEMLPPLATDAERPVVVILGLEHLFLEESLPEAERRGVLGRVLEGLGSARRDGLAMVVAFEGWSERGAAWWRGPILRLADRHVRLERIGGDAPKRLRGARGSPIEGPRGAVGRGACEAKPSRAKSIMADPSRSPPVQPDLFEHVRRWA